MDQAVTSRTEWQRFWTLVVAACVGFSFMSLMTPAAGVFMQPIGEEFGWTRTQLSMGIALSGLVTILLAPFIGMLIDRVGARRLALPGIVATSLAIAAFSLVPGSFAVWLALWGVWGLCSLFVMSTVWAAAVASTFRAARGLALGVTMGGSALATVISPPLANWLIGLVGWRMAFVWIGAGWGLVAFTLAFFFLIDIATDETRADRRARSLAGEGLTVNQAWRDWSLWRVAISTFLILSVTIAVVVHQFPIIVESGIPSSRAAWLVSLSGVAGIIGKLITGALLDRYHARWIGGLTLASTAIAYPLLIKGIGTPSLILLGVMISGYAAGTKIQLCGYLTARYAGMRNYGAIFGLMTSAISLSSVVGPLLAGVAHDRFGTYTEFLMLAAAVSLVSGGLILSLGRYPEWDEAPDA